MEAIESESGPTWLINGRPHPLPGANCSPAPTLTLDIMLGSMFLPLSNKSNTQVFHYSKSKIKHPKNESQS